MPDEILTLPEVAHLLKGADKTVYTMAQKGNYPRLRSAASGGSSASILITGSNSRRPCLAMKGRKRMVNLSDRNGDGMAND